MAASYRRQDISYEARPLIEPHTVGNKEMSGRNSKGTRLFINAVSWIPRT